MTPLSADDICHNFTCPKCGGHYFGRDAGILDGDVVALDTVRCHGDSSGGPRRCDWRGVWPLMEHERDTGLAEPLALHIRCSEFTETQKIDLSIIACGLLAEARKIAREELRDLQQTACRESEEFTRRLIRTEIAAARICWIRLHEGSPDIQISHMIIKPGIGQ